MRGGERLATSYKLATVLRLCGSRSVRTEWRCRGCPLARSCSLERVAELVMNRWLLEESTTAAAPPLAPRLRESRRARCCGKASCASGCALLAAAIAVTSCAVYSLVVSIGTTARCQQMLVVECNITHGQVVETPSTTCTGGELKRALAPWLRRLRVPEKRRVCYAPQW